MCYFGKGFVGMVKFAGSVVSQSTILMGFRIIGIQGEHCVVVFNRPIDVSLVLDFQSAAPLPNPNPIFDVVVDDEV